MELTKDKIEAIYLQWNHLNYEFLLRVYKFTIFEVIVRTTLPIRTASQGASFAYFDYAQHKFKKSYNTPAMPLLSSTLSGFFRAYV